MNSSSRGPIGRNGNTERLKSADQTFVFPQPSLDGRNAVEVEAREKVLSRSHVSCLRSNQIERGKCKRGKLWTQECRRLRHVKLFPSSTYSEKKIGEREKVRMSQREREGDGFLSCKTTMRFMFLVHTYTFIITDSKITVFFRRLPVIICDKKEYLYIKLKSD